MARTKQTAKVTSRTEPDGTVVPTPNIGVQGSQQQQVEGSQRLTIGGKSLRTGSQQQQGSGSQRPTTGGKSLPQAPWQNHRIPTLQAHMTTGGKSLPKGVGALYSDEPHNSEETDTDQDYQAS